MSDEFPLELKPYFRGEWAVGLGLPSGRHEGPTQDALWPAAGQPRLQPAAALPPMELLQKGRLYMVADGVSSCADGSEASRLALETIGRVYYEQPAFTDDAATARAERLRAAVWAGHQALLAWEEKFSCWRHGRTLQVFARERLTAAEAAQRLCPLCGQRMVGLQATLLAAVAWESSLTLASVGDSIAWRLPGNARQPLQPLAAEEKIYLGSPGLRDEFLHVHTLTLEPGDRILLAGDGVTDLFSVGQSQWREELRRRLSGETTQLAAAARALLRELAAKGTTYPEEYNDLTLLLLHYPTAVELAQLRAAAPGEQAAGELPRLLLYVEDEALLPAADATTRTPAALSRVITELIPPTAPLQADVPRTEGPRRNKAALLEDIRRLAGLMTTTPTPDRARQLAADCQEFLARSDLASIAAEKAYVQEQLDRALAYLNEKLRDREALLAAIRQQAQQLQTSPTLALVRTQLQDTAEFQRRGLAAGDAEKAEVETVRQQAQALHLRCLIEAQQTLALPDDDETAAALRGVADGRGAAWRTLLADARQLAVWSSGTDEFQALWREQSHALKLAQRMSRQDYAFLAAVPVGQRWLIGTVRKITAGARFLVLEQLEQACDLLLGKLRIVDILPPSIAEQVRQIFEELFAAQWSAAEVAASRQTLQRLAAQPGAAAYVAKASWRQKLQDAATDLTVAAAPQKDSYSLAEVLKTLDAAAALDNAYRQAEGLAPQQADAASRTRDVLQAVSHFRPFYEGREEPGLPSAYQQRAAQATAAAQRQAQALRLRYLIETRQTLALADDDETAAALRGVADGRGAAWRELLADARQLAAWMSGTDEFQALWREQDHALRLAQRMSRQDYAFLAAVPVGQQWLIKAVRQIAAGAKYLGQARLEQAFDDLTARLGGAVRDPIPRPPPSRISPVADSTPGATARPEAGSLDVPAQVSQLLEKLFAAQWSAAEVAASRQTLHRLAAQPGAAAYVTQASWRQKLQDAAADLTVAAAPQKDSYSLAEMRKTLDAAAALDGAYSQAEGLDPQQADAASHAHHVLQAVSRYSPFCEGGEEPGLPLVYQQRVARATAAAQAQQAVSREAWGEMLHYIRQWPAVSSPLPRRYVAYLWQWALAQETNGLLRHDGFRQVGEQAADAASWLAAAGEGVKEGLTALATACRAFEADQTTLVSRLAAAAALRPPWQPAGMTEAERQGWQRHQQWFLAAAWEAIRKWLRQAAFAAADSQALHAAFRAIPATAGDELRAMKGVVEILQHEAAIKGVLAPRLRAYAKATAWEHTGGAAAAPADVQRAVAARRRAGAEQVLTLLAEDIINNGGRECAQLIVEHIPALPALMQRLIDSGAAAHQQSWPEAQTALGKLLEDPAYTALSQTAKAHMEAIARFYRSKMVRPSRNSSWKRWIIGVLAVLTLLAVLWLLLRPIRTPPNGELPVTGGAAAKVLIASPSPPAPHPASGQEAVAADNPLAATPRVIGAPPTPTLVATVMPTATAEGLADATTGVTSPSPSEQDTVGEAAAADAASAQSPATEQEVVNDSPSSPAGGETEAGPPDWLAQTQPPLPLGATRPTAVELSLGQAGIEVPADTVWGDSERCTGDCFRLHVQLADFCGSRGQQEEAALNDISDQALYWPLRNGQLAAAVQAPVFGCLPASAPAFLLVAQLAAVADEGRARLRFPPQWQLAETTAPLAEDAAAALRQWQVTKPDAWGIWLVHSDALAQALWRCRNSLLKPVLTDYDKIAAADRTCADQTALLAAGATWPVDRVFLALDMSSAATPSLVWYDPALDNDTLHAWIFGDAFTLSRVLGAMPAVAETGAWHGLARVTAWDADAAVFAFSHLFQRQDGDMTYPHRDGIGESPIPVTRYILLDSP